MIKNSDAIDSDNDDEYQRESESIIPINRKGEENTEEDFYPTSWEWRIQVKMC